MTLPSVQLIHGDCLEVMPTLPAGSVQMVFADLPYGILPKFRAWDNNICLRSLWLALAGSLSSNCYTVFTAAQPFAADIIASNRKKFLYDLVWAKRPTGAVNCRRMPMRRHEPVLVFRQGRPPYSPQMQRRDKPRTIGVLNGRPASFCEPNRLRLQPRELTHKYPTSILEYVQDNGGLHPTQKPVALLEWLINTYTNKGDTVLDPTAGSMTTAIAALRSGRNAICIEKDTQYFRIGSERVRAEQERLASDLFGG